MGGLDRVPKLAGFVPLAVFFLLLAISCRISADSEVNSDLIFDGLEHPEATHDRHVRISRHSSRHPESHSDLLEGPEEEGYWLASALSRVKRSIGGIFSKNEVHHAKNDHKKKGERRANRQHRQAEEAENEEDEQYDEEEEGQEEGQEDYDDEDDGNNGDENGGNEYAIPSEEYEDSNADGKNTFETGRNPVEGTDDEDLDVASGDDGSGEEEHTVPPRVMGQPQTYRFGFTIMEVYHEQFKDRESSEFRDLASRIKRAIDTVYENAPGDYHVSVVSLQQDPDPFKVAVTVDIVTEGFSNSNIIRHLLFEPVTVNHRLGEFTIADPSNFRFTEFGEAAPVEPDSFPATTTTTTTPVPIPTQAPTTTTQPPTTTPPATTTTTTTTPLVDTEPPSYTENPFEVPVDQGATDEPPVEEPPVDRNDVSVEPSPVEPPVEPNFDVGSGDSGDCRGDDSRRCTDGSRNICEVQVCDGTPDCDDGADEDGCSGPATAKECPADEFKCDVQRCIPLSQRCDGIPQCTDETDEHDCVQDCTDSEFKCDGGKCISLEKKCDGVTDCPDDSDERDCKETSECLASEFDCGDRCIPGQFVCDGRRDCGNNADELNCPPPEACRRDQFRCSDGKCIPLSAKCNRNYDCQDLSDERNCPCLPNDFYCKNGFCIPRSQRCDGVRHCQDGSDEIGCSTRCESHQWTCSDGTCIDQIYRCNLKKDCPDNSDEIGCNHCQQDQFRCNDGTCLSLSKRCNGVADCTHSEDEESCVWCNQHEFTCSNGDCINERDRCNGIRDCSDGSDEQKCAADEILECIENTWRCSDNLRCVKISSLCDGVQNCEDSSDEDRKNCEKFESPAFRPTPETVTKDSSRCPDGEFQCREGFCIMDYKRCNGYNDCPGGSDEENCPTTTTYTPTTTTTTIVSDACREDQIDCGSQCIDIIYRCDGVDDCSDGRDEHDCGTCPPDQFQCSDSSCIPMDYRCNQISECADNSDEFDCPPKIRCAANQLTCQDGTCIDLFRQCDRRRDCPDGSDEDGCPSCLIGQFQCLDDNTCIDESRRCDRRNDCADGSDEYNCPTEPPLLPPERRPEDIRCPEKYQPCQNKKQCIRYDQLCDGNIDCDDFSDENDCFASPDSLMLRSYPNATEEKERQEVVLRCRDEGNIRAKVHWTRPNGRPLPADSTDNLGELVIRNVRLEDAGVYLCQAVGFPPNTPGAQISVPVSVIRRQPRPTPRPPVCGIYEATCSNGQCIPKDKLGDGIPDCTDGSDEDGFRPTGTCEPNEFQCANRKCILKAWRCDSDDDCQDGSDEINCGTTQPGAICEYHQFACHSNNQCIPKSYHCDMQNDCVDGSDEIGCSKPVISQPPPPVVRLHVGETFEVTCRAVAIPTPEIVWRLNWGHVPAKCRMTSVNGYGTLVCENIEVRDQGAYSCESLNSKGATFAVPDTILTVQTDEVCRPGYFNVQARSESECIKCFCFGQATTCKSADLFIFQINPPFDTLKLLGVRIDPSNGVVDIRDEPIYRGSQPTLMAVGAQGVQAAIADYGELSQSNVVPYFAMPENYHGNQLKSYGGYLKYNVKHSNRGYRLPGPSVIVSGNGYILQHQSTYQPSPNVNENIKVRFFEGEWIKKLPGGPERIATREEIMMVLEDVDNVLIKLQYNEGPLNTTITNIEMDSAGYPDTGLGSASYVEECSCPAGYTGSSCERCEQGYVRQKNGPWLGQCYREPISCPPGMYNDGRECQICPCPSTDPSNQFGRTCNLGPDGDVICNCPPGYVGNRCQQCAPGYVGDPRIPGDSCRRIPEPAYCDPEGSLDSRRDPYGRCSCKNLVDGPQCNQCKADTFYLSRKNQFGCIACFCMGVSKQCSSSNWFRDQVKSVFVSSMQDFKIVENLNRDALITEGIRLDQQNREISYSQFVSQNAYYWALPSRYLGNKLTSYGGSLTYTIRHTPSPGGQSSRNNAADVELVSRNNINLLFYNRNQSQITNAPQTFVVPILEQEWQRTDGQQADREHLLMVLADLEAIYIKASYFTNTMESSLISVSLDIASERNTGSLQRALEVEQCHCPTNYTGLSCEDCDVGYTRSPDGLYLRLCQKCECNGFSNDCDPESGVCTNCRDGTTGDFCDRCLPGYVGDPVNGVPCTYRSGQAHVCNCDPRGSQSNECRDGRCLCKANVEGNNCDRCRPGTFGLNSSFIEGCEVCFCSGIASECSESNLYIEQIPFQISEEQHGFTLTDQYHRTRISDTFNINMFMNEISYNFRPSQRETLYWSLPHIFTGNQIKSYGGKLEYTQRYTQRPQATYVPDKDVILTGNGITIFWTNPEEQREEVVNPVSIPLHPSARWFRLDQNQPKPASREDILMVLANIETILIRATQSSDTSTSYLSDITLDTAIDLFTGKPRATSVESCRCPQGYRGSSCEACDSGFYRDLYYDRSKPLGSCSRCPCNDREESCELGPERRVICHCKPDYSGNYCEFEPGVTTTTTENFDLSTVTPPPTNIEVTIQDANIGIYATGSTVRYNCSARSYIGRTPDIMWRKADGELPPRAIDDGRGMLVITNLRVSDSGRYVCEASDGYSIQTTSVNLNVGEPNNEAPRIVLSQPYIDVNEGQPIEVQCAATGVPTPELSIVRPDGQRLNPTDFTNGRFYIPRARLTDSGEYQCLASNRISTDSARFVVNVRATSVGPIMKVDVSPSDFTGTTGDTVILRCTSNAPVPTIRWSKQGGRLPFNSREDRGTLMIYNVTPDDSGVYICTITSSTGTTGTNRATVSIKGSNEGKYPTAKVSPDRLTISQGESTEIPCIANGIPPPSVKWTRLGGELGRNAEQIGSALRIRNARVEDRGVYVCVSTNIHGIEQASVVVEVTRLEAPILEIYPTASQTVVEGNSAIVQCRAISGIPSPNITWNRADNQRLSSNIEEMSGGTLRFMQITPYEGGEYICTAINEAGSARASAYIVVQTPPVIQVDPPQEVITRRIGDPLRLECQATGVPQPSVGWTKYTQQINRQYLPPSLQLTGSNIAFQEFNRLSKEDEGYYICTAENSAGTVEKRIQLIVDSLPTRGDITEPPSTNEDATSSGRQRPGWKDNEPLRPETTVRTPNYPSHDQEYTATVGERAELICRIEGDEGNNIEVRWSRADGSALPPDAYESSGTLYIDRVQPSAAGEYRCTGIDPSGRPVFGLNAYLTVIMPPRITLIPPRQVVHPGENAYINCSATGEQPITVSWSPIGRSLPVSVYTREGYIRFNNIQLQDAGRYLCRAVNRVGEAEAVADVIVEENTSRPAITAESKRQIAPIGSNVTLQCKVSDSNARNSIRWFRENLPLPPNHRVSDNILYLSRVQQQDQGRYYCEITTGDGTYSDYVDFQLTATRQKSCQPGWWLCNNRNCIPTSQLCDFTDDCGDGSDELDCQPRTRRGPASDPRTPYSQPTLYISPAETEQYVGNNVDINCQSSERGAITVWSKLSGFLSDNVQNIGGTLRIVNLKPENDGVYRCEATGRQGVYHKDYNLRIIDNQVRDEPPMEIKRAPRGATVVLECKTDFEQPTTYLWSKQGGQLPSYVDLYSRQIQLNDVGSSDAGTYTCSASSNRNNIDVPIILVVTGIVPYLTQAPNSYITIPTLSDSYIQFSFEISFKPENGNGLVLYNGQKGNDPSGDYIALSLVNSIPEFKYNLGFSTTTVRGTRPIANGEWHTIKIARNRKKVTMFVDGEGPIIGLAEGKYIGLDLTEHLYLGGIPNPRGISPEVFGYTPYVGFVGCISRLKIGHSHLDILRESLNKTGVTTCETCSDNKCENEGACQEALSKEGYTCICPVGFSGPTCNKLKGEACSPYACGVGRCIDSENGFDCQCPLGRAGRRCEREITINEPAFHDDAYIAYPTPKTARRLKITLRVKPNTLEDGILLYCSETEEGHGDFISLAVRDKHLEFRFDAGNGATIIRHQDKVRPGQWHILSATRTLSDGKLIVDGSEPAVGRLAGNSKTLNLQTPLYIGGYDKYHVRINNGVQVYSGFNGCISDINISGIDISVIKNVTDSSNVEDCNDDADVDNSIYPEQGTPTARRVSCSDNPCKNSGQCYPLSPSEYRCSCPPEFTGRDCETATDVCARRPCQNNGVCIANSSRYTCDCPKGFTGPNCDQAYQLGSDAHFDGNGYLDFNKNLLPHDEGKEEIIALEFSTNSSNGLIFWHGQEPNVDGLGQDYISLAMDNGYLEYSFDLGMGPAIIRFGQYRLDDGERHSVILKRNGRHGSIEVDHSSSEEGDAEGFVDTLNCNGNIYLGGTPNVAHMTGGRFGRGFTGCVHGFEMQNSQRLDLGSRAVSGWNVKPCSRSSDRDNIISNDLIN